MSNGKIFISYRREDTSGESGRLKDKLEQVFGQECIFYDVETLEAGLNFDQSISKALSESKVLLAMIGPHWLKVTDANGKPRIMKSQDWVRKEISLALQKNLRVIPILVNGARMPDSADLPEDLQELSLKHAQELSSSRWNYDVGELIKVLEKIIDKKPEPKPQPAPEPRPNPRPFVAPNPQPKSWWAKNFLWVLGGFVGFLLLIGMCMPNETETFPVDDTQTSSDENSVYNSLALDENPTNAEESESQNSEQSIPNMAGEWVLTMNGERISIFAFGQTEADVAYYEYDVNNTRTGEGSGQITGTELVLNYTSSVNNMIGTISLSTTNSGQTWVGTIYFPANSYSAPVMLTRN